MVGLLSGPLGFFGWCFSMLLTGKRGEVSAGFYMGGAVLVAICVLSVLVSRRSGPSRSAGFIAAGLAIILALFVGVGGVLMLFGPRISGFAVAAIINAVLAIAAGGSLLSKLLNSKLWGLFTGKDIRSRSAPADDSCT